MKQIHIRGQFDEADAREYFDSVASGHPSNLEFPLCCAAMAMFWYVVHEYEFGLISTSLISLFFAWRYWQHARLIRKRWIRAMLDGLHSIRAIVDDHGVAYSTSAAVHDYTWNAFDDFSESSRLFLLSSNRQIILRLPKQLMSAEEQSFFRDRAIRALRPHQQATPTLGFPVVPLRGKSDS